MAKKKGDTKTSKRIVAITDLHCGHLVGLTPPRFRSPIPKWDRIEAELWDEYQRMIDTYSPVDALFVLGDCIDGRKNGSELITGDRNLQVDMAIECINEWHAETVIMVYGTPRHVSTKEYEDYERWVAQGVNAKKIGSHEWVQLKGTQPIFDLKHTIGTSTIPHGRFTSINRDALWSILWAESGRQPHSSVLLRGHVHFFGFSGTDRRLCITLPALQGMGSKFGSRLCSGIVDWGIVYFDVNNEQRIPAWGWDTVSVDSQKAKLLKV